MIAVYERGRERRRLMRCCSAMMAADAVLLASLAAGVAITLLGVGPIQLLFFGGIVGGLGTPLTLVMMMLAARDPRVMGAHRVGRGLAIGGWAVTVVVTLACGIYLWQPVVPRGH